MQTQKSYLFEEHQILGAQFQLDEEGILRPISYGQTMGEHVDRSDCSSSCTLADMDGAYMSFVEGKDATRFIHMLLATHIPAEGHLSLNCILTGEAHVVAFPYVACLSQDAYLIFDYTKRAPILSGWIEFVQHMQDPNTHTPIFQNLTITDEKDSLIPLSLRGDKALHILRDYTDDIPQSSGTCSYMLLDGRIPAYICCLAPHAYILITPAPYAKVIWRSLLSFQELDVEPAQEVLRGERLRNPAFSHANTSDTLYLGEDLLCQLVDIRSTSDFIGARSLRVPLS